MTPPRLVLDTNVLVSALIFKGGASVWLRSAWHSGKILPLASRNTTTELLRVLGYPKFSLTADERDELLAEYLPWCKTVEIPAELPVIPACRDEFDRPFLELALAAKADGIVTGDQDLHALKAQFPVPILTISEIRTKMGVEPN